MIAVAISFVLWIILLVYILYNNWLLILSQRGAQTQRFLPETSSEKDALQLPRITMQLPVYNEPTVIERLLLAIEKIEWPRDRLQIQLLDDSDDQTSAIAEQVLQSIAHRGTQIEHIRRAKRTGFKAGALADVHDDVTGEYIFILDADFVPQPSILHDLYQYFDDDVALVQGCWARHDTGVSNLVERVSGYWTERHFSIEQPARANAGHFMHFNGSGGMWRKSAIDEAGGWDDASLAEDMELSFRVWELDHWRFVLAQNVAIPCENPSTMTALRLQQGRWAEGSMQMARRFWQQHQSKNWQDTTIRVLHHSGYGLAAALWLQAMLSLPLSLVVSELSPTIYWAVVIPGLLFLLGLSIQIIHRFRSGGTQAGKLEFEAVLVALGLSTTIFFRSILGLLRDGGVFERTPKYGDNRLPLSPMIIAECATLLLSGVAAYISLRDNVLLLAILPSLTMVGTGIVLVSTIRERQ